MAYTLNENLKRWAEQYETADFINADPVQIPHRYDSRVNIEISAFVTAWIAWGNRKQIIKKADFIDREIFKGEPYHYIAGNTVERGNRPEWEQYKGSTGCLYRTFTFGDFHDLCARLYDVYTSAENMETAIKKAHETNGETALATLQSLFGSVNGIPDFDFVILFAKVLDKVATGYSSSEQAFIRAVGMTAFNITMQKLINDEKARNNGNGDDK